MALLTMKPANHFPALLDSFFYPAWENRTNQLHHPATNVYETKEGYSLEMNVPGRNKEDFQIAVEKNLLTISYEMKSEQKQDDKKVLRREFSFQSFKRTFSLDDQINSQAIEAKYENGVLKLWLPKKEEVKETVKQITVS
jgi:HSP20 family protein